MARRIRITPTMAGHLLLVILIREDYLIEVVGVVTGMVGARAEAGAAV
jgi:hypothetical protein